MHALEENELFEQTLLRGPQIALEQQPGVGDIDALMRSMMVAPPSSNVSVPGFVSGVQPLSQNDAGIHGPMDGQGLQSEGFSPGLVPGKRSRNGTRRKLTPG